MTTPLICLAVAIYFEARGEPELGQAAVAHVILNRVESSRYPDDVCSVVKQPAQFSFYWDGRSDYPRNRRAYMNSLLVAVAVLDGDVPDPTDGALWYHALSVEPVWAKRFTPVLEVGQHIFYKEM